MGFEQLSPSRAAQAGRGTGVAEADVRHDEFMREGRLIKEGYKRMSFMPGSDPDFQTL
jgi:hypothetical protein